MTTVYSFSDPSDGRIRSSSSNYNNARNGTNLDIDTTTTSFGTFGQARSSGTYRIYQFLTRFPYVLDPDAVMVSAYFRFRASIVHGSQGRIAEVRELNWGSVINNTDWASPSELSSAPLLGRLLHLQTISSGQDCRIGGDALTDRLRNTGQLSVYLVTNRQVNGNSPPDNTEEYNQFQTADVSGTASDPALVYTTIPISTLDRYLGSQVQLSDGTHVVLEHNAVGYPANVTLLRHHDGSSISTIANVDREVLGSHDGRGAQASTLVRDGSDNLYVIGRVGFTNSDLVVIPFAKGSGHSWSSVSPKSGSMPNYSAPMNNLAGAWHPLGTGGTIALVTAHQAGHNSGISVQYALLNCNYLLTGSGSMLRANGSASGGLIVAELSGFNSFGNETGTLLDVAAAPGVDNRGFVICTTAAGVAGNRSRLSFGRYQLNSGGTAWSDLNASTTQGDTWGVKDAGAKARAIGISSSQFATVTADPFSSVGLNVYHRQNIGTSSTFSVLSSHDMENESISSMPSASMLATSSNWDAIYDPSSNFVWLYYFDAADSNRLMRTHIDLSSGQAARDEHEVSSAVGPAGSTNHAIRVHRGQMIGDQVLVTVANESAVGVHSSIYIVDRINVAPTQPSLVSEPNFDAGVAATFEWTFSDPNEVDSQSAYQLQIERVSDGVNVFDSGKVVSATSSHVLTASTLVNEEDYRWRVKTWDEDDAESVYSNYSTFSTTNAGTVTIIDPSVDNPAEQNVSSYLIEWTATGTTQEEYRVRMFVNSTNELLLDTGWLLSVSTTHLVDDIPSDEEVRFEVQVRSSGVASVPGTRLYTTSYATPPQPILTLTTNPALGFILVGVENPNPEGDVVQVEENEILRRRTDIPEVAYTKIGETGVDDEFRDYSALAKVEYEYVVRGRAVAGHSDSDSDTASLALRGVWIHNPSDPQGTVQYYPYGNQSGGSSISVEQAARHYAGRKYPVVDYGEHQDDVMSVSIQLVRFDPYYPDSGTLESLIEFAGARQALTVRDGFGRGVVGSIEGWQESQNAPEVYTVAFAVRQVDRSIETVEV